MHIDLLDYMERATCTRGQLAAMNICWQCQVAAGLQPMTPGSIASLNLTALLVDILEACSA
jgi:hypothetical protein